MKISVINQKGGSGKTSFSVLIILALASIDKSVLAVDCDPQYGLSKFMSKVKGQQDGLFDFLMMGRDLKDLIIPISRHQLKFDLLPADYRLDKIAPNMDPFAFERKFKNVKVYDFIVFDNPPTIQGISRASSFIADKIFVPADISEATLDPTLYTLDSIKDIKKKGNVVLIGYKEPKPESRGYMANLSREFKKAINGYYVGTIPKNVTIAKSIADESLKWTPKRIEKILNPILDIIGVK